MNAYDQEGYLVHQSQSYLYDVCVRFCPLANTDIKRKPENNSNCCDFHKLQSLVKV